MNDVNLIRLPVKHAYNVRDLGGYPCSSGKATNWKTFLRADDLSGLSEDDMQVLIDYGVRFVIDLRSREECAQFPNPFAHHSLVGYANLPLMENVITDASEAVYKSPHFSLGSFYVSMLESSADAIRRVFDVMAQPHNGAVLFHCAAGKDRTGVIAALLLGLAGVDRADIIANYETTYTYMRHNPLFEGHNYDSDLLLSKREYIETMLDYICENHGGIQSYLQSDAVNLPSETVENIKTRFIHR